MDTEVQDREGVRVPTIEVRWVVDKPRTLIMIIMDIGMDGSDDHMHVGTGSTIVEALERLASNMRRNAEYIDDNRMRKILGVA